MSGPAGEVALRSAVLYKPPFGLSWTLAEAAAAGNGLTAEVICEWASAAGCRRRGNTFSASFAAFPRMHKA